MSDRDMKGRFVKGNKVNKGNYKPAELNTMKSDIKVEVVQAAHSLLKPWQTLSEDLKNPNASRLEYLTGRAIQSGNTKFIQWVLERAIGKAVPEIDNNDPNKNTIYLKYNLESSGISGIELRNENERRVKKVQETDQG